MVSVGDSATSFPTPDQPKTPEKSWPNFRFRGRGDSGPSQTWSPKVSDNFHFQGWGGEPCLGLIGYSGQNEPKILESYLAFALQIVSHTLCMWRLIRMTLVTIVISVVKSVWKSVIIRSYWCKPFSAVLALVHISYFFQSESYCCICENSLMFLQGVK